MRDAARALLLQRMRRGRRRLGRLSEVHDGAQLGCDFGGQTEYHVLLI